MPDDTGLLSTVSIELIALILTVAGGFVGLSYQIGRRARDVEVLADELRDVREFAHEHDRKCDERNAKVDARLADGSTKMALLGQSQERMETDIREIKDHLLSRSDTGGSK